MKKIIFLLTLLLLTINCKKSLGTANKAAVGITTSNKSNSSIGKQWYGKYEGSFLRLEGESADPRGWATVNLNITKDSMVFNISSYVEEKTFKLTFKEANEDNVAFSMDNNNIIKLKRNNKNYMLESTYIDTLMKNKNQIKLSKSN